MTDRESAYQLGAHPPVNQNQILFARAVAIQAYASLELSLCTLFASLLGIPVETAAIVFFRIINTGSRNRILDELCEKKFEKKYSDFWNSVMKLVRALDQRRNEIVHWHMVQTINLDLPHPEAASLCLKPPAGWMGTTSSLTEAEMNEFIEKCSFVSRAFNMFGLMTLRDDLPSHERQPWLKIFQETIAYPPPDTHPLSPNYAAPQPLPQSP